MKSRILLLLIIAVVPMAQGQEFKKVVDIVVDMEASLKNMIATEASQRKTEIASLKTQVQELRASLAEAPVASTTSAAPAPSQVSLEFLQRVEALEHQVASLRPSQEMSTLAGQLSTLVTELKKSVDESKTVQANTDKAVSAFKQAVQVNGQVFAFYSYTTDGTEGKGYNRFDIDRMYLTAKASVFEQAKAQLTTDIFRNSATGSYYPGLSIRVKFAYVDYAPVSSLSLKLGMIPTVWAGFIDSQWKYRGIAPSLTDRNSFYSTADIGLSIGYTLPEKLGEVTGFLLNGSGYTSPETNRFKDFGLRINVTPFSEDPALKGIVLAGYAYKGSNMSKVSNALKRDRIGAFVGYSYAFASIGAEYDIRKDSPTSPDTVLSGNGFSIFGEIKAPVDDLKNKLALVWRYDVYEPNVDKGHDMQRYTIFGIVYKPHDRISFALDRQWIRAESDNLSRPDNSKTAIDSRWFLHTIFNF